MSRFGVCFLGLLIGGHFPRTLCILCSEKIFIGSRPENTLSRSRERGKPDGAWALFLGYGALKGMNNCGEVPLLGYLIRSFDLHPHG